MNEIIELSLDMIDAPHDQQRVDINDDKMEELRTSIRDHGLISPIQVRAVNGRYELIAGSRRLKCYQLLDKAAIAAIVMNVDEKEADILRAHENEIRHDVNPIESGVYVCRLQEKYGLSVSEIAKQLNKSDTYVRGRLELMTYPDYILEQVGLGKLSAGAASHLAKIEPDGKRRQYVTWAVWRGVTAIQAWSWLQHAQLGGIVQSVEELPNAEAKKPSEKYVMTADCIVCRTKDDINNMGMYYAHSECERAISGPVRAADSSVPAGA